MPHTLRVFCRKATAPTAGEVLRALTTAKLPAQLAPDTDGDLSNPAWEQIALELPSNGGPLIVDRDVKGRGPLLEDEVRAFLASLERMPRSKARDAVIKHLRGTEQAFGLQVPTSSIDSTGWAIAHAVMRFFVARCGGLVHADGEGFYRGNDLVLELA